MAYEKNTWASGDVVTSEKLNHIEDGIADSGGIVTVKVQFVDTATFSMAWGYMKEVGDRKSIEGVVNDIIFPSSLYNPFLTMCLPLDQTGEYTLGLIMSIEDADSSVLSIETSGGIASEYVSAQELITYGEWASNFMAFFPITGSGTMTIEYTE